MGYYSAENIESLKADYLTIGLKHQKLLFAFTALLGQLKEEKAKEYLFHGATRRIGVIARCIDNIFRIYPLDREQLLTNIELKDIDINLHSFFINIFGFLDNLAWVFVHEKKIEIDKKNVGLFFDKTKVNFTKEYRDYLESEAVQRWFNIYLKDCRDALSHRIPVYVPPKILTPDQIGREEQLSKRISESFVAGNVDSAEELTKERETLGSIAPVYRHSVIDSQGYILHPQIIIDFKTIELMAIKYLEMFGLQYEKIAGF